MGLVCVGIVVAVVTCSHVMEVLVPVAAAERERERERERQRERAKEGMKQERERDIYIADRGGGRPSGPGLVPRPLSK